MRFLFKSKCILKLLMMFVIERWKWRESDGEGGRGNKKKKKKRPSTLSVLQVSECRPSVTLKRSTKSKVADRF
jgi:hypothetical protein